MENYRRISESNAIVALFFACFAGLCFGLLMVAIMAMWR